MAMVPEPFASGRARRAEHDNADMRLWMRLMIWATRNCAR
jgi:hypothetical protein